MGDYLLNADNLIAGGMLDDAVSMGTYHRYSPPRGHLGRFARYCARYTIPLRSLIARDVDGLLMAGKCISATHEAIASTRVIPICMGQGQAAGTVAALAVKRSVAVRAVPVRPDTQDMLAAQGADFGRTVGEPNWRAIEEVGELPFDEPPTTGDLQDPVSSSETA